MMPPRKEFRLAYGYVRCGMAEGRDGRDLLLRARFINAALGAHISGQRLKAERQPGALFCYAHGITGALARLMVPAERLTYVRTMRDKRRGRMMAQSGIGTFEAAADAIQRATLSGLPTPYTLAD